MFLRRSCTAIFKNSSSRLKSGVTTSDVAVIGGGAMGASVAYWLSQKSSTRKNLRIVVIERDPTYSKCSTALSVGGIRQQFSLLENIQMSLFGVEFFRTLRRHLGDDGDVSFKPNGYLLVAGEKGAEQLTINYKFQQEVGACNELLTKNQLAERHPWLNVSDVELGCLGGQKEGWFDPWRLLGVFKNAAIKNGVQFLEGEVIEFLFSAGVPRELVVKLSSGERSHVVFDQCVIAAGSDSGELAKQAGIGTGGDSLAFPLPVERRKRYVYRFDSQGQTPPGANAPLTIDTGAYFRPEGSSYIGGVSPTQEEEPSTKNLDVDYDFFDRRVWPLLAHRIPAFESVKVKGAWAGYYDYNYFDSNGIIGPHPCYPNLYFVTGFSGHGIQQSPAAGLAIAELIIDGRFETIDLTRMGFQRIVTDKPLYEIGIY